MNGPYDERRSYAVAKPTHEERAEAAYLAGWHDAEQGFPRGWSLKRDECDGCVRKYNAGFTDYVEQMR